jgi:hypothetical protein
MSMIALAALLLSGQSAPPARSASDLTRDLNSAPPSAVQPRPAPRPAEAASPPSVQTPAPTPAQTPAQTPAPSRPTSSLTRDLTSGSVSPAPVRPAPAAAPSSSPAATPPSQSAPVSTPVPRPSPSRPAAPAATPPLSDQAQAPAADDPAAALPFRIELPPGFEIEESEAGPHAKVYAVRRDDRSFVMIYSGPASQFPIYDGELIDAGGRASVVVTEDGRRRAVEHMFTRDLESRETHVWISSLEGPDSALAEQIAQSVEPR